MKKYLLSILFAMFGIITYAQNEPAITLTAKVEGKPLTLNFAVSEAGHKFKVDWGDGNLVETEEIAVDDGWTTTTVTGTPLGEGKISVLRKNSLPVAFRQSPAARANPWR